MTSTLAQLVVWLNALANALGKYALAPISVMPGWLSATLVSVVTGILLLLFFKYTSNQRAIKRVRNNINAHLLALKLFKESASVALRAQGRILWGACRLMVLALVPMAIMTVPVCLLLGQLALWYQARPLRPGEEAILTLNLNGNKATPWPTVRLQPTDAVETTLGPVRAFSKRSLSWNIKAGNQTGYHELVFEVDGQVVKKEVAIGNGFLRVSAQRPGWSWTDALLHPWERPFPADSPVRSIEIAYPHRASWTSGTNYWVIYWFAVSMVAAFAFRRVLNVNV